MPTFFRKVDPLNGSLDAALPLRTITNLPANQILLGRVMDIERKPVANAVVSVDGTKIGNTTYGSPPEGTDPLAITDEQGEFFLSSQKPFDAMNLQIEARGFARRNFQEMRPGPVRHELAITEGALLSGRVLREGKPVNGVSLGVVSVDRTLGNFTGEFQIGTKEDGKFHFLNLPPDREYQLYGVTDSFRELGALPARTIRVKGDGSSNDAGDLSVVPGRRLAGQVTLSDSKSIPEHTRLVVGRRDAWDAFATELPPDGKFDLSNLPPESLTVRASLKGYRHSSRNVSLDRLNPYGLAGRLDADKTDLTILLEPGETLRSDYESVPQEERAENLPLCGIEGKRTTSNPWVITGNVEDAGTKTALAAFRITPGRQQYPNRLTQWQDSRAADFTNGSYTVELSQKAGPVVLLAEAAGYLPAVSETLTTSQTNFNFRLKQGSGPKGILLLSEGRPAGGVKIFCLGPQEQVGLTARGEISAYRVADRFQTLTGADGRFSFPPRLGEGEIVVANTNGFARVTAVELSSKSDLTLQPWARVTGALTKDGKGVAGEDVDLRWTDNFSPERPWINLHGTKTEEDGRFVIEHVPPGSLQITTRIRFREGGNGWSSHPQHTFTASPGESVDVGVLNKSEPSTAKQ